MEGEASRAASSLLYAGNLRPSGSGTNSNETPQASVAFLQDFVAIKEQIRDRVDLVEFVSEHTALRRRGRVYIGLCPFHQERTPSFQVHPERQFFKCFGCGVGGDLFTFLQLRENVDFKEAIRILADRAGVELEPVRPGAAPQIGRPEVARINEWACRLFRDRLQDDGVGAAARRYAESRGITPEIMARFQIGLATGPSDYLWRAAEKVGFGRDLLLKAGLCKRSEDRGTLYDTFRDRLMFPIHDVSGRCIGFGGRTLVDAPAKYMNTPETVLFDKSRSLFGLQLARDAIVAAKFAVVVEGYTDCIAAQQHGFSNTVATLGTAATEAHMATLRRYCDTVVLMFDSDEAGDAAADRALAVGLKQNLTIRLAQLPAGSDPGDFLQTHGKQEFSSLLNSAEDALRFKWDRTRRRFREQASPSARKQAVSEFVSLVAELSGFGVLDPIQQGVIIGQLENLLSVPSGQIQPLLAKASRSGRRMVSAEKAASGIKRPRDAEQAALVTMLEILLNEPGLFDRVSDVFLPERLTDPICRRISEHVVVLADSEGTFLLRDVLARVGEPAEASVVTDLVTRGSQITEPETELEGARARLLRAREARDTGQLTRTLKIPSEGSAWEEADQRDKLAALSRRLKSLQVGRFAPQRALGELSESDE